MLCGATIKFSATDEDTRFEGTFKFICDLSRGHEGRHTCSSREEFKKFDLSWENAEFDECVVCKTRYWPNSLPIIEGKKMCVLCQDRGIK